MQSKTDDWNASLYHGFKYVDIFPYPDQRSLQGHAPLLDLHATVSQMTFLMT
jgi:hypothetical protein